MRSGNAFTGRLRLEPKLQNIWGIEHAIWFFCMGMGSGLYLLRVIFGIDAGTVLGMPLADVLGIILVGIGGLILIADLGRPLRFLRALANVRHSWISWGAIADFIFLTLGVLLMLPYLTMGGSQPFGGLPWGPGTGLAWGMELIASICAVYIIVYPGLALSFSPSIPFWNTTLIPLSYIGTAMASGVGIAYLFGPAGSDRSITIIALVSVVASLFFLGAHVLNARQQRGAARLSADKMLKGSLAPMFVWGAVVAGLVLPAVLLTAQLSGTIGADLVWLVGILMIAGNFFSKYAVIKAGYFAPLF